MKFTKLDLQMLLLLFIIFLNVFDSYNSFCTVEPHTGLSKSVIESHVVDCKEEGYEEVVKELLRGGKKLVTKV